MFWCSVTGNLNPAPLYTFVYIFIPTFLDNDNMTNNDISRVGDFLESAMWPTVIYRASASVKHEYMRV